MKYDFDEIIDRSGTHAVKLENGPEGAPADSIMAWVADMDFTPPQPILDALGRRLDQRILGYTIYDNQKLKSAVTGWFRRRHDWEVSQEEIFYSPSVIPALSLLIQSLSEPGDGIIIQNPVYRPFTTQIENNGRRIVNSPLINDGGAYTMDFGDLHEKFSDPKVTGMIFCNPHNPVGRVWQEREIRQLVDLAKAHDKWIISDEIHMDLVREGVNYTPLLKAAPEYQHRIITCTAPSKTFNLAGLGLSNIVIPNPDYQEKWKRLMEEELHLSMANPFAIEATIAAYNDGDEWLDQLLEYLDKNFAEVTSFVERELPEAVMTFSEGTYLAWIDLNGYIRDADVLEKSLISHGIIVNQGIWFGPEGSGFIRINLATPHSQLIKLLERLKSALVERKVR